MALFNLVAVVDVSFAKSESDANEKLLPKEIIDEPYRYSIVGILILFTESYGWMC